MDYSGLNAKIKGMKGNLLKYDDYDTLSRMHSVGEIFFSLKEKSGYGKLLSGLENTEIHRNTIEQKVYLSINNDYGRINSYISDYRMRKFISAYFLDFEIHIIKLLLGMLFDERDINYSVNELKLLFNRNINIDIQKLAGSKNVSDFIENLNGSEYYPVLSHGFDENDSLFELEMQLDLYYYTNLWKKIRMYLDKQNQKVMRYIVGTEIDLRNIIWIYRLKTFFDLKGANMYACLIPISYMLSNDFLSRLVETKSSTELLDEILNCPYGHVFNEFKDIIVTSALDNTIKNPSLSEHNPARTIETAFYGHMKHIYTRSVAFNPNSLATTVAYFYDKELEIMNLSSLIECVRYGLDPKKIMKYLCLSEVMEVG